MSRQPCELARRLAREAEAVCRRYLSNGKRAGRYWVVGDVHNNPGRSLFVRLQESPKGAAGKWTDAATGAHGDLLDIIRETLALRDFREVAEEARRFLNLPRSEQKPAPRPVPSVVPPGSQEAARRLLAISSPIEGTIAEAYLQGRGITRIHHGGSLRFHPRCYYRPDDHLPTETWPAMIAGVTDLDGRITGVHRRGAESARSSVISITPWLRYEARQGRTSFNNQRDWCSRGKSTHANLCSADSNVAHDGRRKSRCCANVHSIGASRGA